MSEVVARFSLENNPLNVRYSLSDGSEVDAIFKINAAGTTWGSIDGTLSNQTDLQNALDTLDNKIDGVETDLSGDIAALAQTVEDNNIAVNNRIDTTNDTVSDLSDTVTSNYNTLDNKIDNEISSRTLADTTLQNNIDAEALARQNADGSLQGNIDTLSATVTSNYNTLDGKISDNTGDITAIQNTINTYGDIVTYNAADFATSTQGALADSALQPGDNISALVNNVGYITSASLPTDYVPNTRTINGYALTSNITLNYSDVGALSSSTTINDLTTTAQQNALNSGATATNIGQITTNANDISDIQDLIPSQASSSNQLADKDFVNSSIATNTANFIGTFNSVAELEAYSGTLTNNDYAFVATTDSAGNTLYDRYKYNADTQEWLFEYELNNSSFTAQQWASINSGITSNDVTLIGTALQPNDNVSDLANDAGYITSADLPTVNNGTLTIQANGITVGTFTANQAGNTTANIVVPDSATWGNITGVLSSQTDLQDALDDKYDASNPSGFITGITSSDVTTALGYTPYNSTNPNGYITISALNGYATETWVTNQGYITGITSSDVTTALGYTPYNATNPNGYITASALTGYATETYVDTGLATKQATLVSGTNIKTINNNSILGSGNLTLDGLPTQTGQSGKFLTTDGTDASWGNLPVATSSTVGVVKPDNASIRVDNDGILSAICRNVGEIISSTLPLTDAGLHLLDGSLILGGGIYQGFVDYIADLYTDNPTANYFTDETTWQNAVTTYGVCGKFVYDSVNNTVRLPKVTGIIEGTVDASALGDLVEAGLPNITGSLRLGDYNNAAAVSRDTVGAFRQGANITSKWPAGSGTSTDTYGFDFDASRSSSIYGNSSTVQPQTIKEFYYIVIANSTKTEIQSDIDEIATDLNGKADIGLTNINNTGYSKMAGAGMPSTHSVKLTVGASGSTYTAPANGWYYICGAATSTDNEINMYGRIGVMLPTTSTNYAVKAYLPVSKGEVMTLGYRNYSLSGQSYLGLWFCYAKGSESEVS